MKRILVSIWASLGVAATIGACHRTPPADDPNSKQNIKQMPGTAGGGGAAAPSSTVAPPTQGGGGAAPGGATKSD